MKTISVDPTVVSMDSALEVLEALGSVVVERCADPRCEVCGQELEVAA